MSILIDRHSFLLAGVNVLWSGLVEQMLNPEPLRRPPADVIFDHPALWENARILTFLQDVSDRVEKEEVTGSVLEVLETGAHVVCLSDWRAAVDPEVTSDLRKYRSYRGDSVRDLLRALRNKRHHFRELSEEAQRLLGSPATTFTEYWLSRFPLLLPHSWGAMQCVRHEPLFTSYYHSGYIFPAPVTGGSLPPWWNDKKQELLAGKFPSPSKSVKNKHDKKGCESVRNGEEKDQDSKLPISDFLKISKRGSSPRLMRKSSPVENEQDDIEKENWVKEGQNKGVYRPRPRVRRRPNRKEEEPQIWSVPP